MADSDQILRDLIARVDVLEQENRALRHDRTTALASPAIAAPQAAKLEQLSRRWVLRRAARATAATVVAGALVWHDTRDTIGGHNRQNTYTDGVYTHVVSTSNWLDAKNSGSSLYPAVKALSTGTAPGILGENSGGGIGIRGEGNIGMHGISNVTGNGAVWGQHTGTSGIGVVGDGVGTLTSSVLGRNPNGSGVRGDGAVGVHGTTPITGNGAVYGQHLGTGNGVVGDGAGAAYVGVLGRNATGIGVRGEDKTGVHGESGTANWGAVTGKHTGIGYGVVGDGGGATEAGVLGRNSGGHGVRGEGTAGVVGVSSTDGWEGVYGQHTGSSGYGVVGDGTGTAAGVLGRNSAGEGLRGEGIKGVYGVGTVGVHGVSAATNSSALLGEAIGAAAGVKATSQSGYGAVISGGKAQLRLVPRTKIGKPTTGSHQIGELSLDKVGSLFICTAAGTPGTWKTVTVS